MSAAHHSAPPRPLTAQVGSCGATQLPRHGEIVVTASGRHLILNQRESGELEHALRDLREQRERLNGRAS